MSAEAPAEIAGADRTEPSLRLILAVAGGLALGVAVTLAIAGVLYFSGRAGGERAQHGYFQEGPAQRTSIAVDQAQLRQETRARLEGYGWVDRSAGVVRIPIERAMELEAEKGEAK